MVIKELIQALQEWADKTDPLEPVYVDTEGGLESRLQLWLHPELGLVIDPYAWKGK